MQALLELTRRCAGARDALRTGTPLPASARDALGAEALPYLSLANRGMRYAARSDRADAPSADLLIALEGITDVDLREQLARARLAAITDRPLLDTPHPDALLAFQHARTVLNLLPLVAPRLLQTPTAAGLRAPRSGMELTERLLELESNVSRLAAGSGLLRGDVRRTVAYFEVAALRLEQLAPIIAEL